MWTDCWIRSDEQEVFMAFENISDKLNAVFKRLRRVKARFAEREGRQRERESKDEREQKRKDAGQMFHDRTSVSSPPAAARRASSS